MAIAEYGGPIAFVRNKDFLGLKSVNDDNIRIYDCKGKLHHNIEFSFQDLDPDSGGKIAKVVLFTFLEDETLFILMSTGDYFLLDPSTGKGAEKESLLRDPHLHDMLNFQTDRIKRGQIYKGRIVVQTAKNKFYIKKSIDKEVQFQEINDWMAK